MSGIDYTENSLRIAIAIRQRAEGNTLTSNDQKILAPIGSSAYYGVSESTWRQK